MQSWWLLSARIPPSANVGRETTSKGKRIRKGSAPVERQPTPVKNISFPGSCLAFLCVSNIPAFTLEPGTLFMVWDKALSSYYQQKREPSETSNENIHPLCQQASKPHSWCFMSQDISQEESKSQTNSQAWKVNMSKWNRKYGAWKYLSSIQKWIA